ncbi:hypothetical protein [Mycobacterium avium]|uniref:hypothetical protein n=1 Tax=Mycobacterium avium TaxID=1764 RepID=UPI00077790F3|nr:hypothetical protein [Mycobacterium avium]
MVAVDPEFFDERRFFIDDDDCRLKAPQAAGRLSLSLNGLATDLDTEHGGTDANKRDEARQLGWLNVAGLQL